MFMSIFYHISPTMESAASLSWCVDRGGILSDHALILCFGALTSNSQKHAPNHVNVIVNWK